MALTERRLSLYAIAALIAAMALAFTIDAAVNSTPSAFAKKKKKKCRVGKEKQGCKLSAGASYEGSGPNGSRVSMEISSDGVTVIADGKGACGGNPNLFEASGMGSSKDKAKVGATLDIEGVATSTGGLLGGTVKILNAKTAKADLTIVGAPSALCPVEVLATLHRD